MAIGSILLALVFIGGVTLLFGFIANRIARDASANRRAAYAAVTVAVLLMSPAYVVSLSGWGSLGMLVATVVGTLIMAAVCFPIALSVTRRQAGRVDLETFD